MVIVLGYSTSSANDLVVQDTGMGLKAVDSIAARHHLDGVYGPLYRLFEITDQKFNIAIELTAGNRWVSSLRSLPFHS